MYCILSLGRPDENGSVGVGVDVGESACGGVGVGFGVGVGVDRSGDKAVGVNDTYNDGMLLALHVSRFHHHTSTNKISLLISQKKTPNL